MAEQESPKTRKVVPFDKFITHWPLYTPAPVDGFYPPTRISFHCDGACAKETTWIRMQDPQYASVEGVEDAFKWVCYLCGLCNKKALMVMYKELENEKRSVRLPSSSVSRPVGLGTRSVLTKVQKIGQSPALSVEIPKALSKNLGEEAVNLYRKGLVNRNNGYGLGAVTYIRRVVEDKTNELIEVAALLAESHHVAAEIVAKIRAAATQRTTYDQKLKIAATVLPEVLIVEGANPLAVLYDLVSEGVHGLSEEECIAVADETSEVFEYIFTNLRAQIQVRKGFVEKVTKWAGRGSAQREAEKKG